MAVTSEWSGALGDSSQACSLGCWWGPALWKLLWIFQGLCRGSLQRVDRLSWIGTGTELPTLLLLA